MCARHWVLPTEPQFCYGMIFEIAGWNLYETQVNTQHIEQNGFRLVERIDDTSRTLVWKAIQTTLDRTVIIQVLKPEVSEAPSEVDRFLTTARLFARIKSDSIAAVFDIVSEGDLHYVVMEHVDGPTLEELVSAQGPLPLETVLRIAASLITSLEQMWTSAHIVHRNLKSATIRLDTRGVAKITDFSRAIVAVPGVDVTATDDGHIVGTPCFLSPEQAQGARTLNTQSDMYALGAVLYHLTTGKMPFEEYELVSILSAHIKQQIPPPHRLNRRITADFSWFLHRLMMKNPNNRYADWDDVLNDIRHMLADSSPSCVRPDEKFLSTIANDFGEDGADADQPARDTPRIRLNRKEKNGVIATHQEKHSVKGHAHKPLRKDQMLSTVCWSGLFCWLALVFWFRAVYQSDPAHADTPSPLGYLSGAMGQISESLEDLKVVSGKDEDAEVQAPAPVTPAAQEPAVKPAPPPPAAPETAVTQPPTAAPQPPPVPDALPAGIPTPVLQGLALALANGDLVSARQIIRSAPELFQEKEALQALLDQTRNPDTLVTDYLKAQIGKPLLFEHNGKQLTVIPRSVENGIIQLEANGRGAEFPVDKLTADEKLRWMERPKDAAQSAAYCMTLLHSSRRAEIHARAVGCPLLSAALIQALELVPAVKPPAE